ncbi:MAG: 16S rRNA (adenine(1518)-N(6)/adenine(1519)-N(6))-dimethyltransferase RsmA [Roseomonas sp.]|nr:16S rRNA (adenine(1518)-N(6)/adenine(1519)-N(6))-dimethyltransferase RsmA [Roseomonas sp.]MCA3371402.1 16S rRNA (adenine(1518)-N(6)/adenine(1519)-N(6))-dimethyltransferase RsmA [Roseomonas sp.]
MTKPVLPSLGDTIARHGLNARKALGQHFLLDPVICARIAALAGDLAGRHVLEVGPGPGGLTRALLDTAAASVLAVELDARAVVALQELVAAYPSRLRVREADALGVDPAEALPAPRRIIANLPYNVASPLLVRWLRSAAALEGMTLMFQLEVAERITAAPATSAYGRLAVLAQWRCRCDLLLRLPPGAFSPPPKVWSAVVGFVPHAEDPPPELFAAMEKLTAAAFGQRRKMLRGALKALGGAEALLEQAGIAGDRRGETLTVVEFDRLARGLASRG